MNGYALPAREIPIYGQFDVLVAGGGPAGCAAALHAARRGKRTLLLEKDGFLGGAAVSQGSLVVLSTNGQDFQGTWHEFMAEMKRIQGIYEDEFLLQRAHFTSTVDPEKIKLAWDRLLSDAGVRLLHHSQAVRALVKDGAIEGVAAMTKAGQVAILAKRVIDCTGDALVCHDAGVPWDQGAKGEKWAMALTKTVRLGGIRRGAGPRDEAERQALRKALEEAVARGEFSSPLITTGRVLNYIGVRNLTWHLPKHRSEINLVTSRVLRCDPLDPDDITRAEREGRQQMDEVARFYRQYVPGCEQSYLADSFPHVGVRSSRRVHGLKTATDEDALTFAKYPDGIARSSWDIDVWPPDSYTAPAVDRGSAWHNERLEKLRQGEYFDIRYGSLLPQGVDNLLMAGRIISAEHLAEASLRIQQTCMATGEAAGIAAALSLDADLPPRLLDPKAVVQALEAYRKTVPVAFPSIKAAWDCFANGQSLDNLG